MAKMANGSVWGYRRKNGRVGVRNHVIVMPLDDISNAAAEGVARNIAGAEALPHAYGRLQFGEDLKLFFRTMIGSGANPNVAAVVVIGIEPDWTNRIVEGIAETGKPVTGFSIEGTGDLKTIEAASRKAKEYVQWASERVREECLISDLWIATKCGESDTTSGLAANPTVGNAFDKLHEMNATLCFGETTEITGAEHVCASRAASPEVAEKFMKVFNDYQDLIASSKDGNLLESQPSKGNIHGGLSTIEEKAYGNLEKIGKKTVYIDVLEPAESPAKGPGLYFMDTSSAAAECLTLQAAAGYVLHCFPTGQGNVVGNALMPVIKLSANPKTCRTMSEHIDLDVSGLLQREINLDKAGDMLLEKIRRTSNGLLSATEVLMHREFVLTKLYRSA